MNLLIKIQTDSELISYEAMSLAFVLASFDHRVQICLSAQTRPLFLDSRTRIFGMIQSLSLYDMPMAWTQFDTQDIDVLTDTQTVLQIDEQMFDAVVAF